MNLEIKGLYSPLKFNILYNNLDVNNKQGAYQICN